MEGTADMASSDNHIALCICWCTLNCSVSTDSPIYLFCLPINLFIFFLTTCFAQNKIQNKVISHQLTWHSITKFNTAIIGYPITLVCKTGTIKRNTNNITLSNISQIKHNIFKRGKIDATNNITKNKNNKWLISKLFSVHEEINSKIWYTLCNPQSGLRKGAYKCDQSW